jgi:predicted site-specific integrase-resolvase
MTKLALTIPEAAEAAGVTEKQVRAWIHAGDLKARRQTRQKDGAGKPTGEGVGRYLVLVDDLRDCLERLPAA